MLFVLDGCRQDSEGFDWLAKDIMFNGTSIFDGYLMPNPVYTSI